VSTHDTAKNAVESAKGAAKEAAWNKGSQRTGDDGKRTGGHKTATADCDYRGDRRTRRGTQSTNNGRGAFPNRVVVCQDYPVATNELPDRPGWYRDPYAAGCVRWFDGSMWTTHAVRSTEQHPDHFVQRHHDERSSVDMRTDESKGQFPWWDTAVSQGSEPPFAGGGGARGFSLNQRARFATRLGQQIRGYPFRAAGWCLFLAVLLFLMAWSDTHHRTTLLVLGAVALVASLTLRVRTLRNRKHWKKVGEAD
jgi:hypothetical protein